MAEFTYPYERAAMRGEDMPDGLELPDQLNFLCLRSLYGQKKAGMIDRAVGSREKAKLRYQVYEARCDSAEQTMIQGLAIAAARDGLGIEVLNAIKGPINERIAFYNSMIAQDRFRICAWCVNTIRAMKEAVYDAKKPLEDIRLDDGSTNIDSLDSMEYATEPVQSDILYLGLRGVGA